jgi:hypothetical protein
MSHFKCRFLRENKVYEYDGMKTDGGYFLVTSESSIPPMLFNIHRASMLLSLLFDAISTPYFDSQEKG